MACSAASGFLYNPDMLDERARTLLKTLVEHYIADGQPVGSRALSKFSGLDLSHEQPSSCPWGRDVRIPHKFDHIVRLSFKCCHPLRRLPRRLLPRRPQATPAMPRPLLRL